MTSTLINLCTFHITARSKQSVDEVYYYDGKEFVNEKLRACFFDDEREARKMLDVASKNFSASDVTITLVRREPKENLFGKGYTEVVVEE